MLYVEKTKEINYFKQFDYMLLISVILLTVFGIIVLGSATKEMTNGAKLVHTQVLSFIAGVIIAIILAFIDYRVYRIIGIFLYLLSVALLLFVLYKGVGEQTWGSRSWLAIPVLGGFQPSEIGKITFILIASMFLERLKENPNFKDTIKLLFYCAVPISLVALEPDYGMAIVFVFILAIIIFVFGVKYRFLLIFAGAIMACAPLVWFFVLKDQERRSRILEFFTPGKDPLGSGYQVDRAQMAIGSGRFIGSGLYKGIQTQSGGVPVIQSDFIFAAVGEELGFIGAMALLIVIFIILLRSIYVAKNANEPYGSFVAAGIAGMFGFDFIQNVGMCLGIMPVTGLPLPFVSSGGSFMLTNYIAVGILLSISIRRRRTIFNAT